MALPVKWDLSDKKQLVFVNTGDALRLNFRAKSEDGDWHLTESQRFEPQQVKSLIEELRDQYKQFKK